MGDPGWKSSLMLHTLLGKTPNSEAESKETFCNYLKTHFGLVKNLAKRVNFQVNSETLLKTTETAFYRLLLSVTFAGR